MSGFKKTDWASIKSLRDTNEFVMYYVGDNVYTVVVGDRYSVWFAHISGSDASDFETNYKAAGISVASTEIAVTAINAGLFHVFTNEALADGVYEDSTIVGCDFSNKTFTIENKHATGGLKYKIWASANNTDYEEIKGETVLAAQIKTTIVNNDMWKYVKVAAKGDGAASTIDSYLQVGQ